MGHIGANYSADDPTWGVQGPDWRRYAPTWGVQGPDWLDHPMTAVGDDIALMLTEPVLTTQGLNTILKWLGHSVKVRMRGGVSIRVATDVRVRCRGGSVGCSLLLGELGPALGLWRQLSGLRSRIARTSIQSVAPHAASYTP